VDPLSHAALGAGFGAALRGDRRLAAASIAAVAAVAPDFDALVRSASDPLLYLELHRSFSHSLVLGPLGALLCAGLCCG
jgi:inner membrane protein